MISKHSRDTDKEYSQYIDFELRSLNTKEYLALVDEIILNENIKDGTNLCFQIFDRIMNNTIDNNVFNDDYNELNTVSKCIKRLKGAGKYDSLNFAEYFFRKYNNEVPLEIIWWLVKEKIMCITHFQKQITQIDFAEQLLKYLRTETQHVFFEHSKIVEGFLFELIGGCYLLRITHYRIAVSRIWTRYCSQVLDNLADRTLNIILTKNTPENFQNYLLLASNLEQFIPGIVYNRIYKNVLQRLIMYNGKEFDLYSSYVYQELWCSTNLDPHLSVMCNQIFSKHCNFQDILDIMEGVEDKISLKYTLIAVGVCVAKSKDGPKDVKAYGEQLIKFALSCGNVQGFTRGMLFIRQACMENEMQMDYGTWFSIKFGRKGGFQPTKTTFTFLIKVLTILIPYEPKSYIMIHIKEPINTPKGCNTQIYNFLVLTKARLAELKQFRAISLHNVDVNVIQMFEESIRNNNIDQILKEIIKTEDFHKSIVPELSKNDVRINKIKDLLIKFGHLTETMDTSIHHGGNNIYNDDDDNDFF